MAVRRQPFDCPACGEEVPAGAKSCPDCGACERSGWSEAAREHGLGLSDDEFDYEKFVAAEFGGGQKRSGMARIWWITAIVVLLAFVILLVARVA
jgi:hypothetical protein